MNINAYAQFLIAYLQPAASEHESVSPLHKPPPVCMNSMEATKRLRDNSSAELARFDAPQSGNSCSLDEATQPSQLKRTKPLDVIEGVDGG